MATGLFALVEALDTRLKALETTPASGVTQAQLDTTNQAVAQVTSDLAAVKTLVGTPT